MKLGAWLVMLTVMILFLSLIGLDIAGLNPINEALGVTVNSTSSEIINADIENSSFWGRMFGETSFSLFGINFTAGILIALLGTGGIVIGLFAKGYDVSLVILPIIVFVGGLFISTFWSIISYVKDFNEAWMTSIVAILFVGLGIGFVMSCVDYFAGR
jgi:hypothetical protein